MPPSRKEIRELDAVAQWQIEEIKKALDEADRGEFASDEEVEQVLKRWTHGRPTAIADSGRPGEKVMG
jgi:predicted transcriptional regulator